MPLRLEARAEASARMRYGSPLVAVLLTVRGGLVVCFLLGRGPLHGFRVFFYDPVKDLYGISELLLKATPLMLIATGLAVGFSAKVWKIGAEGQFLIGAVAATGIALAFHDSDGVLVLPAMLVAGAIGGALWAAIPAFLKTRFNTNEILVSLMLVYVAQFVVSWVVFGPWKEPQGFNFPQTVMFSNSALLPPLIPGTRLTVAFVIAIAVLVAGHFFMNK